MKKTVILSNIPGFALFAASLFLIFLSIQGCNTRRSEPIKGALNIKDEKVERGRLVFMEKCQKCHPAGEAGLAPSLNDKPAPGFLVRFQIRHGLGTMPSFKKDEISKGQMNDLISYIKKLRKHTGENKAEK
jgi:mono/diheme cytochrome c family protein